MLIIYGASDDLIEVEGDIRGEISAYFDEPIFVACSNGTLVRIVYDGTWSISKVFGDGKNIHSAEFPGDGHREDGTPKYSDVYQIDDKVDWVVGGKYFQ